MAALTTARNTPVLGGARSRTFPVTGGVCLYPGAMAGLSKDSGFIKPMGEDATLTSVGRVSYLADNRLGGDGDEFAVCECGIFHFENSAGADEITAKEIGQTVYAVDDQTVAKTSAGGVRPKAGTVWDVDPAGVWLNIY